MCRQDAIVSKEKNGFRLSIVQDLNPMNPREEFDHIAKFFFFHRRYNLGDKDNPYKEADIEGIEGLRDMIVRDFDPAICKKVYMYDHSGITINTTGFSCPWDSGVIGIAFITKEDLRKNYGKKRITKALLAKAEKLLDGEIKEYDQYLRCDIYGFVLESVNEKGYVTDTIDSCFGFYGDYIKEALSEYIGEEHKELIKEVQEAF
jgi:hypothetical protein